MQTAKHLPIVIILTPPDVQQRQHLYSNTQAVPNIDTEAFAIVEIRKLIDQQISKGTAPSVAVVTAVLSYFYSWTSSKVGTLHTAAPQPTPGQVGSGVGQEFVAAYHAAETLQGIGFSTEHDFLCCDRAVNVTLQVGAAV